MIKISAFADESAQSLSGQIAALKKHGFKYIDIRIIDRRNVKDFSAGESREYARQLKEEGIEVNCIGSPIGKVGIKDLDFEAYTDIAKGVFETANIFGTDKVRVFSFYNSKEDPLRVYEYMSRLVALAADFGLTLYNENEKGLFTEKAEETLMLLSKVPGLENVFDGGNYVLCGESIDNAIELLADRTKFFHIKDATLSGKIVPPGEGDAKIAEMLKNRSDVFLTLEPHLFDFMGLSGLAADDLKFKNRYNSASEAFDAGAVALKKVLNIF